MKSKMAAMLRSEMTNSASVAQIRKKDHLVLENVSKIHINNFIEPRQKVQISVVSQCL